MLHVANMVIVLVFCIVYSSFHNGYQYSFYRGYERGLYAWLMSLASLSWYGIARNPSAPEYYMRKRNIIPAFGMWIYSLLLLGIVLHDYVLLFTGVILLLIFLFYFWKLSRKPLNLALVLRGEITHLKDIEEHIQKTRVKNNRVELINSLYAEEHLHIVNESERHLLRESREEGLLTQLREKERSRELLTFSCLPCGERRYFSCLLHGEWRHLEPIRAHIADYLADDKIQSSDFVCSMDRLYFVNEKWTTILH